MSTPLTKINIQKSRLAQLQQLARQRGLSTSALLEELIREEWSRTQKSKPAPIGFVVKLAIKNDLPVIEVGGDDIGIAALTLAQSMDLARGATLVLGGQRKFTTVVGTGGFDRVDGDPSWINQCAMVDVVKQGRGFVVSIVRGQGESQTKKSQAISGPLLKDLIAAIVDRAMASPAPSSSLPDHPGAGAFS